MTKKEYNDQFISTFADGDYEVAMPPFFVGYNDLANNYRQIVDEALDLGIHEDIFSEDEIDAAHRLMGEIFKGTLSTDTLLDNAEVTAIARSLYRHSEVFPEKGAEDVLEDFRPYVNRHRREIFPGG